MELSLLISMFTFFALALFALWALQGVGRPAEARLKDLAASRQRGTGLAAIPFQQRTIAPVIEGIGRFVTGLLPGALVQRNQRRLVLAGEPMRPVAFYTLALGLGATVAGMYLLLLFVATGGTPPFLALLLAPFFFFLGAYIANFWLSAQARGRQKQMIRGLPDSMDLLTVCVEAGLSLDAAFQRVTEKQSGPFVDEVRQMLREIGLGKTRRQALLDLCERTDLDDVRSFASAIIQAEQLGTSIAQVLRIQSQRLRVRRRQRAEQEARRAPVKMVFPLVFCLMPSLFIFILGPIIINLVGYLSD